MKTSYWYIKFPKDAFALGPVYFDKPVGPRDVRKWARDWAKLKRLPNGFSCWPSY